MANVTITDLPAAGPITGTESVPIVQNGQTVQTTTAAIAASPSQTQTFLTVNQESTLPNSRYLSTDTGLGLSDGGAQSYYRITLNGASGSLETASNGIIAKTNSATVAARTLSTSGAGISVTNGDGVSGNPTFQLTGLVEALANASPTGLLVIRDTSSVSPVSIAGVLNQTTVTNGNGYAGNPTVGLADNPILPGTGAVTVPIGTTGQQPVGSDGQIRFDSTQGGFYGYSAGQWRQFSTAGGVTLVNTGTGLTGGPITSTGTISIDTGVVATLSGTQTLTNKTISGADNTLSNIGNSSLTNSAITINGVSISLGGSDTITAASPYSATFNNSGTGDASGTTFNGSAARTISYNSIGASPLAGSASLTTVGTVTSGTWNASPIGNSYLANSSITVGTTSISLGGSSLTLGGLTSVAVTQNPVSDLQLATKQYVDNLVAVGTTYHDPVYVESPDTAGSLNATYNNGTAGVGATLTNAGTLVALTLDGVLMTVGKRVLIYNQSNQYENGIYTVTTVGDGSTAWVLTRATDADSYGPGPDALDEGSTFFVQAGNTGAGETYTCTTQGTIVFGTTAITFAQIGATQVYSAGTGLTLSGTQFSLTTPVVAANGGTGQTSYTTGDLIYASGSTALSKLGIGTSTYLLTSSGSAPQWSNPSGVSVGSATTATNLAGGSAGAIAYNTGLGATTFLTLGTSNYVLTAGATAPQYVAQSTLSVGSATTATNVAGGAAGSLVYQTAAATTSTLALGTTDYVLTAGATAPQYVAQSTLSVGSATNATNATNVAVTSNSTNATNYLAFVSATTGNLPTLVNSGLACNPSTGKITAGISGGTF